jgi:hypothetical protein
LHYWFRVTLVHAMPCLLLFIFTLALTRTIKQAHSFIIHSFIQQHITINTILALYLILLLSSFLLILPSTNLGPIAASKLDNQWGPQWWLVGTPTIQSSAFCSLSHQWTAAATGGRNGNSNSIGGQRGGGGCPKWQ